MRFFVIVLFFLIAGQVQAAPKSVTEILLSFTSPAQAQFVGCVEFCQRKYKGNDRAIDNCYVQTQNEGKCGGGGGKSTAKSTSKSKSKKTASKSKSKKGQQQQHEDAGEDEAPAVSDSYRDEGARNAGAPRNHEEENAEFFRQQGVNQDQIQNGQHQQELPYDPNLVEECSHLRTQILACEKKTNEAIRVCDSENNSELKQYMQTAEKGMDQIKALHGLAQQTGAIAQSCTATLTGIKAGLSAFNTFQKNCAIKKDDCSNACNGLKEMSRGCEAIPGWGTTTSGMSLLSSLDTSNKKCDNLKADLDKGSNYMAEIQNTIMESQMCAAYNQASASALPQTCFTNPNTPECRAAFAANDCSNPAMASSPTCAFMNACKGGLGTPACQAHMNNQRKSGSQVAGGVNPGVNRLDNTGATANGFNLPSDSGLDPALAAKQGSGGSGEEVGGRQGGGANVGGGGGSGGDGYGPSGGGTAANGFNTNISGGLRSGGGGGGGWGSAYGSGGGGGGGGGSGSGYRTNGTDLSKYNPNMPFQKGKRNLAGVVGPDGILGPHANAWQMISNRYQYYWRQGTLQP